MAQPGGVAVVWVVSIGGSHVINRTLVHAAVDFRCTCGCALSCCQCVVVQCCRVCAPLHALDFARSHVDSAGSLLARFDQLTSHESSEAEMRIEKRAEGSSSARRQCRVHAGRTSAYVIVCYRRVRICAIHCNWAQKLAGTCRPTRAVSRYRAAT